MWVEGGGCNSMCLHIEEAEPGAQRLKMCDPGAAQVSFYHRNVARQQQQLQQWLQKRRQENATRRLAGEEALPEEDPALFKPIPEPSPLDGFLINNQV